MTNLATQYEIASTFLYYIGAHIKRCNCSICVISVYMFLRPQMIVWVMDNNRNSDSLIAFKLHMCMSSSFLTKMYFQLVSRECMRSANYFIVILFQELLYTSMGKSSGHRSSAGVVRMKIPGTSKLAPFEPSMFAVTQSLVSLLTKNGWDLKMSEMLATGPRCKSLIDEIISLSVQELKMPLLHFLNVYNSVRPVTVSLCCGIYFENHFYFM